jgi:predicted outer membrane protein
MASLTDQFANVPPRDSASPPAAHHASSRIPFEPEVPMLKNYAAASALVLALSTPAFAQGANDFRLQSMQANAFEIQSSQIALSKSRNPKVRSYAQEVIRDHRAANVALAGGQPGAMAGGDPGLGGLVTAPIAVAGSAVGAGVGAATGVVGGTLSGGPVGGLEGAGAGAARGAAAGGQIGRGDVMATGASTMVQPSPEQQAMLAELSATPAGSRFDRLYATQQIQAHQMSIAMTQAYAQGGPNPALRNYAQQALPALQMHYAQAQRLPGAM